MIFGFDFDVSFADLCSSSVGSSVEKFEGESCVGKKARWWVGEYEVRAMWIESLRAKRAQMELEN